VAPGFYELPAVLAQHAGSSLMLGVPATGLLIEKGHVQGVVVTENVVRCQSVIFTGGATALRRFLGQTASSVVPVISEIRFQGIVCGVFRITKKPTGAYWTNVTVPNAPFNVVVQQGLFGTAAAAFPVVYASRYVDSEQVPTHDAEDELDCFQNGLDRFFGIQPRDISDRALAESDDAGPVFTTGYGSALRKLSSTVAGFHVGGMLASYPDRSIEQSIIEAERLTSLVLNDVLKA
jgi:protoporphyrinogen oxidase